MKLFVNNLELVNIIKIKFKLNVMVFIKLISLFMWVFVNCVFILNINIVMIESKNLVIIVLSIYWLGVCCIIICFICIEDDIELIIVFVEYVFLIVFLFFIIVFFLFILIK